MGSSGTACVGSCGIACVGSFAGVGSLGHEVMVEAREVIGAGAEVVVSDWACKEIIGDGLKIEVD